MTYTLVIPPELVRVMYEIRESTGVPIRRQIINAVKKHIEVIVNDSR